MATKKHTTTDDAPTFVPDFSDEDPRDEEAGLVPKGDTATDDAPDVEADEAQGVETDAPGDSVGEAVESIDTPDPNAPPAPITAHSSPEAKQDRVLYENWVNSEAEAIAVSARTQAVEALLAGGTVEIVVHLPNAPSDTE